MKTVKINKNKIKDKGLKSPTPFDANFSLGNSSNTESRGTPSDTTENSVDQPNTFEELPQFEGEKEVPQQSFGSLNIEGEQDTEEFRPEVDGYKGKEKRNGKQKIVKPKKEQTEKLDINIEMSKATGDIEGSDFDTNGNLKKKRKKSKKAPLGGIAVLLLLGVVIFGGYKFANKEPVEAIPEDLTSETPINDPVKDSGQYVPPVLEDPPAYLDDVTLEEDDEEVDESKLTPEELKQRELDKLFENYLTHDNTYTNISIKYPSTWYITEKVQESFNEIKALSKEDVFSFTTAELENRMDILQFKSPEVENTSVVEMIALPAKDFDKTKLFADFELPKQLVTVQPEQFTTETWGTRKLEVGYFLKQEFNLTYLVVQAHETVGSNVLLYTFKEPFFDTADFVAEEEEVGEDVENKEQQEDKVLTVEELNELTPSLQDYKNIVTSVEVK